jgi:hypothetical protein
MSNPVMLESAGNAPLIVLTTPPLMPPWRRSANLTQRQFCMSTEQIVIDPAEPSTSSRGSIPIRLWVCD